MDTSHLPNHPNHPCIVKTLEAHNGRISLNEFKKKYNLVTNNIPSYPRVGVRKWIVSAEGVAIRKGVVQFTSEIPDQTEQTQDDRKMRKRNKGEKENAKTKGGSPSANRPTPTPQKRKKKRGKKYKTKVERPQINLPICNDCYYGMENHQVDTKKSRNCIMHFGSTSDCKTRYWPGDKKKQLCRHGQDGRVSNLPGPFSRAIVSGYIANKIKKSGGQKAARQMRNLARLRSANPMPAFLSSHAKQRYKERGLGSSPIYKSLKDGNEAIVLTYVLIQRKYLSDAKNSSQTIQLEVDRMSKLSKKSELPTSNLSSRDAHLFKLSRQATKEEEWRHRSQQKKKAYSKQCSYPVDESWTPLSINTEAPQGLHIHGRGNNRRRHKLATRRSTKKKTQKRSKKNSNVAGRAR